MAYAPWRIFSKKNFFFFFIKNRSILGLRQEYFFFTTGDLGHGHR
jgi:hypothetical protein